MNNDYDYYTSSLDKSSSLKPLLESIRDTDKEKAEQLCTHFINIQDRYDKLKVNYKKLYKALMTYRSLRALFIFSLLVNISVAVMVLVLLVQVTHGRI